MKDTKEVVLFFKQNTKYVAIEVANEILNRYEELGNPLVLPETENYKAPLIVFNSSPEFQIQANYQTFTIVVNHSYFKKLPGIIFDIVDALESFDCTFTRIGYISSLFLSPKYIDVAKSKYLKMDALEGVTDINMGWYKKINTKCGDINCWERIVTDDEHFKDLLCQYDFNSRIDEEIDLDMKYIKEFIKVADEYIEDRTNF